MRRLITAVVFMAWISLTTGVLGFLLARNAELSLLHAQKPVMESTAITVSGPPVPLAGFEERAVVDLPAPNDHPPSRIQVGPYNWKVRYVQKGPDEFGDAYYKLLEFRLDPTLPLDQLKETLLHEIFHAAMFVGAGGTSGPAVAPDARQLNDQVIEETAPTVLMVFRDNPELMKWLERK